MKTLIKGSMLKSLSGIGASYTTLSVGLLFLRITAGSAMLFSHGWPKVLGWPIMATLFPDPIGTGSMVAFFLAVLAEVVGSIMIIAGIFTRFAAGIVSFTMAVAFFIVHAGDNFSIRELAYVYLVIFLFLMITGPGKFSVDERLMNKINRQK